MGDPFTRFVPHLADIQRDLYPVRAVETDTHGVITSASAATSTAVSAALRHADESTTGARATGPTGSALARRTAAGRRRAG